MLPQVSASLLLPPPPLPPPAGWQQLSETSDNSTSGLTFQNKSHVSFTRLEMQLERQSLVNLECCIVFVAAVVGGYLEGFTVWERL